MRTLPFWTRLCAQALLCLVVRSLVLTLFAFINVEEEEVKDIQSFIPALYDRHVRRWKQYGFRYKLKSSDARCHGKLEFRSDII